MLSEKVVVSVVVVNWNGRSWLAQCLPSLQAQSFREFEIIVVDNGSRDGSVNWLNKNWPQVRVISLPQNTGFAHANNVGISAARGEYIVALNNDTRVGPDWLAAMVTAVSTAPNIGMIACQIRIWDEPHLLDSAGIEVDQAGIAWNRGWRQPVTTATTPCEVFGPSGAAALYRRIMLEQIGFFDTDYFAYYEDVDLAWRAQKAGWRCLYTPAACVWHKHSASARRTPTYKLFLLGRNKWWTILKNYEWPALVKALPLILAYDLLTMAGQVWQSRSIAPINGRLAAIKTLHHAIRKRPPATHPVTLSPVTPFWQLHHKTSHLKPNG
ncbi:MAG: glycosyltransferase family 2 protein [Chloroflexi bacterium]|nr:MAG: glycosyltransferase family 2 protein [Chloroflexota bacterium]